MNTSASRVQELVATLNMDQLRTVQDLGWKLDISDRAIRAMLRDARRWAPQETIGPIWMAGTVEQGFRVELAAPSGPRSEHESLTAYPDLDYYNRQVSRFWRHPRLWFAGQWHTHPFQDEPMPSPWDIWGTHLDRSCGWFQWNEDHFNGRGHLEVIMAGQMTRAWWVTTKPDRIHLVYEAPIGIATPKGGSRFHVRS